RPLPRQLYGLRRGDGCLAVPLRALVAFGVEVAELLELGEPLIDRRLVPVRSFVEVLTTFLAETFAVGPAERRERRGEEDLLPEQRREVDLEVGSDRFRVGGSLPEGLSV